MPRQLTFTKFLALSIALHALAIAAMFLIKPVMPKTPFFTPVQIVDLPQQAAKQLPKLRLPTPKRPAPPVPNREHVEKPLPPSSVPKPAKFGTNEDIKLPKTLPRSGQPEGAEEGKGTSKTGPSLHARPDPGTGPLPFLTQKDIDELARKGMPEKKPGDDSVTLDTDEFMFISYNRWLKVKVESILHYPELAAISGYQGTLYVHFDILKDGSLGTVEILKPSGFKILDDEALRSIRSAAPFQPLPDEWKMDRYSIRAAVIFYLGEGYIR